jgi:hypothetical protein
MQQKIRQPHQIKLFQPVITRLLKAIKLSKTRHHQQLMRLALQMKLSSYLGDKMRLPL